MAQVTLSLSDGGGAVNAHTADTIPCSVDSVTVAPESTEVDVVVPRDSEWSGFSLEMATILQELS